ncbi:hypothetical protein [Snodgrassella communis]|uniref:hypothetical protein n=1 Tax=Snodgrassella communis TaxID=2946699 RepID=UPI001EF5D1D9|nr:hypothetical protein [Snodgrassella communis]
MANIACSQKIENQPAVTQTIPQQEFEPTVYQLIDFFNKNDFEGINQYIHKDIGLFIINSQGVSPSIKSQLKIEISAAANITYISG